MAIKRVWEVCEPHPDVFARDLDPSLFAASLGQVDAGTAPADYTDAERFFAKTYMTRSLSTLLEGVLARLGRVSGRGAPILQLQTPFGGGKTHTLVALYHLAKHHDAAEQNPSVKEILSRLNLQGIPQPINVAVLDGVALSAKGRRVNGLELRTVWGELAYQLGGKGLYREIQESDEGRTPPGESTLSKVLSVASPALILLDELLAYLLKAKTQTVGASNLMEQTGIFLQELTAAVSANPHTVMIASLPASSQEVPEASEEEAQRLFAFVQKVMGRVEMVETPVAEDEVFGVLRLRLFKDWGRDKQRDVKRAVNGFADYYAQFARSFPDKLRAPDYKARMDNAYPFHPELIDLLYNRWGPHPKFQRTRGALRLLALTIRRMWDKRVASAFLIQPCHLDLGDRHLRGEVVKLVGSEFDAVVTGDITGKAADLDKDLGGDYRREELAKGAATSAFLYSVNGTREEGATEEEIRIAFLRPEVNPAMCAEVLSQLRDRLHFLVYRDRRYRFQSKANINKLILDYEVEVSGDRVDAAIREVLDGVAGNGKTGFRVRAWPKETRDVEDRAEPALVLVPLQVDGRSPGEWMQEIVQNCGESYRTHKNMVVFVAPAGDMSALRAKARRLEALRFLRGSGQYRSMDAEDQTDVTKRLKEAEVGLNDLLRRTYNRLFRPAVSGVDEVKALAKTSVTARTIAEWAWQVLEEMGLLAKELSPELVRKELGEQEQLSLGSVVSTFTGVPGKPIPASGEVVRETVLKGVREGSWQYGVRDDKGNVQVMAAPNLEEIDLQRGVLLPVKEGPPQAPEAKAMRLRFTTTTSMLYALLKTAELLREIQGQVTVEVTEREGRLAAIREKIEKLLQDYKMTYEVQTISNGDKSNN